MTRRSTEVSRHHGPCSHFVDGTLGLSWHGDLGGEAWCWALGSTVMPTVPFLETWRRRCCWTTRSGVVEGQLLTFRSLK